MSITLREVTAADEAFLLEVYASARARELALVPWSKEQRAAFLRFQFDAQHSHYRTHFPEASYQIVLNDAELAGRLYVFRNHAEIRILDITLLPQYRNMGLGTKLIGELVAEARKTAKPIGIWVEQFNPSQNLFQRLGFSRIQEDGYNYLMQWRPNT